MDGLPPLNSLQLEQQQRVLAALQSRLNDCGNWLRFRDYMEFVLYAPGLGYYAAGSQKFGQAGDFVTAPELSPLFARCLARQIAEILLETGGGILELGAGSGALAHDLLAELADLQCLPERYWVLELSADLAARQQSRLAAAPVPVEWINQLPEHFTGVIIGNEVLDALPVDCLQWTPQGIAVRGVALQDQALTWVDRPLATDDDLQPAIANLPALAAPYQTEISAAAAGMMRTLGATLQRGAILFVDYGFGRREYYHPQRDQGTLMCHFRHWAHTDPLILPGLQDITAHVDFTAIAEAGLDSGLTLAGYTTQSHFLINAGILELLQRQVESADYPRLVAGAQKLLSTSEMGELFKVIGFNKNLPLDWLGFARGDLTRML